MGRFAEKRSGCQIVQQAADQIMQLPVAELQGQFAESAKLEQAIKANLKGLGYGA